MRVHHPSATVLACLITLRVVNVFLVQTWFVPDEYWQSLEVAHRLVHGYGYLTWEWKVGIRSYLFPLLFTVFYHVVRLLGLSRFTTVLVLGPRVIEALLSACAEYCFYVFVRTHFTARIAFWALFGLCTSWCWWYCATRTLTNSFEAAAVCISLHFYCWKQPVFAKRFIIFVIITIVTTAVRPTSLTVWLPLYTWFFYRLYQRRGSLSLLFVFIKLSVLSAFVLLLLLAVDRCCYGDWRNVHFNFLQFNLLQNRASFYGSHPWHWYITQGLPITLGTHLPFVFGGLVVSLMKHQAPSQTVIRSAICVIAFTLFLYSVPGHKEFRFILPLIPFFMLFAAVFVDTLNDVKKRFAVILLLSTNIIAVLYTGLVHQSAPLTVIESLGAELSDEGSSSVLFLLPCHSTPYYSHVHRNVSMRFLTCEPDFDGRGAAYVDEADAFYLNPEAWVASNMRLDGCVNLPRFVVLFDVLLSRLTHLLSPCYRKHFEAFHTHFPEGRIGGFMVVLARR